MNEKETLGQYIRRKREEVGISQRELSRLLDLSPTYINHIENDRKEIPREFHLMNMSKILLVDSDYLLSLAHKVPSDIQEIIFKHPEEICGFLRKAAMFDKSDWDMIYNLWNDRDEYVKELKAIRLGMSVMDGSRKREKIQND